MHPSRESVRARELGGVGRETTESGINTPATRKATDAGGSVLVPITDNLFEGRLAVIADPVGAAIGLIEWTENEEAQK